MTKFMQVLEGIAQWISKYFFQISLLTAILTIGFILLDVNGIINQQANSKALSRTGKLFGVLAVQCGVVAVLYYVVRELYIWLRKKHFQITESFDAYWKSALKILRLSHPFFGFLAIAFSFLHGYFLWYLVFHFRFDLTINFGFLAFLFFLVTVLLGQGLRLKHKLHQQHRIFAVLFFVAYIIHISVK